jgi:hypothetical protein
MWHYTKGNDETRSFEESALETLVRDGEIGAGTLVWREGMDAWRPLAETDLASRVSLPVPVSSGPPARPATSRPAGSSIQASQLQFRFTAWWVCLLAGAPLALVFIGYGLLTASVVFQLMLLHGLWRVVQDGAARTTPDKAIWLSLVPFFNVYWMFVAIGGLPKEMNRIRAAEAPGAPECDENLGVIHCILMLCSVIPVVNFLTGLGALVTFFMTMTQCKRTAMGILDARAA